MNTQLQVGDTLSPESIKETTRHNHLKRQFNTEWVNTMDNAKGNWVVLEVEESDAITGNNRFTSRATRMNAYDYTGGYEFRGMMRSPFAYYLGRKTENNS
jgi:hypothetical protein